MEQLTELTKMLGAIVQQLQQQFVQQQENFQKQQTDVQKQIVKQQDILQKILKQGEWEKGSNTFSVEGIANSLSEFIYKPEEGITFPAYFKRYETIFEKRCQLWSDEKKLC